MRIANTPIPYMLCFNFTSFYFIFILNNIWWKWVYFTHLWTNHIWRGINCSNYFSNSCLWQIFHWLWNQATFLGIRWPATSCSFRCHRQCSSFTKTSKTTNEKILKVWMWTIIINWIVKFNSGMLLQTWHFLDLLMTADVQKCSNTSFTENTVITRRNVFHFLVTVLK